VQHGWTQPKKFKAPQPPAPETPLVTIAFADLGYSNPDGALGHMVYPNSSRTTTHAAKFVDELGNADLVLHNGDIAYATGYLATWERFMSQISPMASRLPCVAVRTSPRLASVVNTVCVYNLGLARLAWCY